MEAEVEARIGNKTLLEKVCSTHPLVLQIFSYPTLEKKPDASPDLTYIVLELDLWTFVPEPAPASKYEKNRNQVFQILNVIAAKKGIQTMMDEARP